MAFLSDPQFRPTGANRRRALGVVVLAVLLVGLVVWFRSPLGPGRHSAAPSPTVETEQPSAPQPTAIFNWVGTIASIEDGVLVVQSTDLPNQPSRRARITPTTIITKLTFLPNLEGAQKRFIPQETPVTLSELTRGQMVEITAQTDISNPGTEEFAAVQIRVLPK